MQTLGEEFDEPFATLFEIFESYPPGEFDEEVFFTEAPWLPELREEVLKLLKLEHRERYQRLEPYFRDAYTLPLEQLLDEGSMPFTLRVARVVKERIEEEENPQQRKNLLQCFMRKFLYMYIHSEVKTRATAELLLELLLENQ